MPHLIVFSRPPRLPRSGEGGRSHTNRLSILPRPRRAGRQMGQAGRRPKNNRLLLFLPPLLLYTLAAGPGNPFRKFAGKRGHLGGPAGPPRAILRGQNRKVSGHEPWRGHKTARRVAGPGQVPTGKTARQGRPRPYCGGNTARRVAERGASANGKRIPWPYPTATCPPSVRYPPAIYPASACYPLATAPPAKPRARPFPHGGGFRLPQKFRRRGLPWLRW